MTETNQGYVFNRTRQTFLASRLTVADSHWTRLKGLIGTPEALFRAGRALWIVPSHGVHTMAMGYPIDVVFLNEALAVVYVAENVKPWRFTALRMDAMTVLELPAHTISNTQTRVGDELEIQAAGENTVAPSLRATGD
jgi:uncharacterized protein